MSHVGAPAQKVPVKLQWPLTLLKSRAKAVYMLFGSQINIVTDKETCLQFVHINWGLMIVFLHLPDPWTRECEASNSGCVVVLFN